MSNPLLQYIKDNSEFIPFDKINSEHFEEAFEKTFTTARENLILLLENTAEPTFENTIEAIEYLDQDLNKILSIFSNLKAAHTDDKINSLAEIVFPQATEWVNDVLLNDELFNKIKKVYASNIKLEGEKARLLENTYKAFIRKGGLLSNEKKAELRSIDQQLSLLSQKFSTQLLAATNEYSLTITDQKDLSGLPDRIIAAAKDEAVKRKVEDAWVFTLKAPSIGPFLQYSDNEKLRAKIATAAASRGMNEPHDNKLVVLEIVSLRAKHAELFGYESHAAYVLDDRMAKNPQTVYSFLNTLAEASQPKALEEYNVLCNFKEKITGENTLYPWDVAYFTEKLRQEKYDFDEEVIRQYFSVDNVLSGLFEHVEKLYGVKVKRRDDIPVYQEDVFVYEVIDSDGKHLGLVYFDLYPRESKRGGGWIDALRPQHTFRGQDIRPQLLIVCNLTKPAGGTPSLLSFREAETIFHEFGHALHNLFSECTYATLGGFNTLWDFVELPSQFMDAFLEDERSVKIVAKHYETQETIPDELLKKISDAKNFMIGSAMLSQVSGAILDMKWHDKTSKGVSDIEKFENEIRQHYRFVSPIKGASSTTSFSHIFDGGYAAGYYSYHWAEVLSADAFEYFQQNELFPKEIANSFRENILSRGNTEEPSVLYRRFRGRDATPEALLRKSGLL